ncbi:MAG TPA: ATP-dependent helicase [Phycisphaerae bacterium]|nr:ATP-dependent helicase [Phycisphaerae bacterium]
MSDDKPVQNQWLTELNEQQRQAVTHGDGPLLVIAGAGTGKTKTLACRVAHLIANGTPAERILLLTFTRRAAAEMIGRARHITNRPDAASVWGGTFHAMANRILRIYHSAVGLPDDFTIMDQSDGADLMNVLRTDMGLGKGDRRFPRKETLVKIYSRTIAAQEGLRDVVKRFYPWCADDTDGIAELFEAFVDRKRKHGLLDYDDLLLFWNVLCDVSPAADAVADRFDHVLVDEYQDTNALQSAILRHLRRRNKNLCVVGDDAQSIYSFRAATVRNILDFPEQYENTKVVKLEQNYRSRKPILKASNAVMAEARERYTKELWSNLEGEQKPLLIHCVDEQGQCNEVCSRILKHLEEGIPLMKQAVLFRTGHHSDMLEVELAKRNIPFHKFGGLKFIESSHIKDVLALLRVLENPRDEISWFRILLMLNGIGSATARRIVDALLVDADDSAQTTDDENAEGARFNLALKRLAEAPPQVPAGARETFDKLRDLLLTCSGFGGSESDEASTDTPPISQQIELIREFYEPLLERRFDNAAMRTRDLEQLEHIATGYRSRRSFISDLTLDPPVSTSDLAGPPFLEEDYLILSTIHSAKGCEWDAVHILHCADGMIPSDMAVGDDEGIEEERRLLYVAMTRAKDHLYAYFPLRYYHRPNSSSDAHSYAQLSRFISKDVLPTFEQHTIETPQVRDDPAAIKASVESVDNYLKTLWRN